MGEVVEMDNKGRIAIPSSIRNRFGLNEGAHLVVETRDDEIVVCKIHREAAGLAKENERASSLQNSPR